jgi:hypothetical protein
MSGDEPVSVDHRLVLELLKVIRDVDGGYCLTRLLFDRPKDEIDALVAAIDECRAPSAS